MDALSMARDAMTDLARGRGSRRAPNAYEGAVVGSRAEGRGERRTRCVWLAGDFKAGEFRTRREALRHCPAGVLPFRVELPSRAEQRATT